MKQSKTRCKFIDSVMVGSVKECWQKLRVNNMARASMTKTSIDYWSVDLGKVCIYDSIENPKKFVDAINAAIDEEVSAATAECDNKIGDLNRALEKAIEYLKMYKDMDLAQNESILNCPEETVSNWIAKIRAIAEGEEQYEEDDVNHVI